MFFGEAVGLENPHSDIDSSTYYKHVVGKAMYIMVKIRLDILFTLGYLRCLIANLRFEHLQIAKTLLKYLHSTDTFSLEYRKSNLELVLKEFSDLN